MLGLYIVAAVVMAGMSSVFALMAELADRYALSDASLGWIAGAAFLGALVTQLSLARYADRGHGLLLLRSGIGLSVAGLLWFAVGTEAWHFIAARGLLGAAVGMIIPAARRAIIIAAKGDMGRGLGTFYAAYLSGFVFGPPAAGLLTELGDVRLPFVVFAAIVALSSLSLRGMVTDDPDAEPAPASGTTDKRVLRRLLLDRRMWAALLIVVSFRYSIGVFEPLWAVFLDDLGASTMVITLSLTAFAVPMLLIARWSGSLTDRLGARYTSVLAAAATVPLMAAYGWIGVLPIVIALVVPQGIFESIISPGSQVAVADAAPRKDTAAAQGLAEAAGSAAAAIGAFTSAPSFGAWGAGTAWTIAATVMAVLIAASALLDPPRRRRTTISLTAD